MTQKKLNCVRLRLKEDQQLALQRLRFLELNGTRPLYKVVDSAIEWSTSQTIRPRRSPRSAPVTYLYHTLPHAIDALADEWDCSKGDVIYSILADYLEEQSEPRKAG